MILFIAFLAGFSVFVTAGDVAVMLYVRRALAEARELNADTEKMLDAAFAGHRAPKPARAVLPIDGEEGK